MCSASNAALLKLFEKKDNKYEVDIEPNGYLDIWLNGIFTKIVVGIDNEEKLLNYTKK